MSIELMLNNCKNDIELRAFASAQQKTLTQLMKKNKQLEDEITELKKLVINGALPVIAGPGQEILHLGTPEQEIAKREIYKLHQRSLDEEPLMLEEAKKLEIYTKVLSAQYKEKADKMIRDVQEIDADSLLALVESK
ncbi:MAG TPA: hypothetical protein VKR58_07390 [Aquella sp.]|nr:hypothetical protein [Aquella sp.]